jgi:hypothetical protein
MHHRCGRRVSRLHAAGASGRRHLRNGQGGEQQAEEAGEATHGLEGYLFPAFAG